MVRVSTAVGGTFAAFALFGCGSESDPTTTAKPNTTDPTSCPLYAVGNPEWQGDTYKAPTNYHEYLKDLDVSKLYDTVKALMTDSQACWPADGPQDGDVASYAGLFGRLAWHCSGTLRVINNKSTGGCEGGRQRFWPEREWRDNDNLDKARALLATVKSKPEFQQLSWGDLITFAGTAGIKASGGPVEKFCFGRVDDKDGQKSVMLGTEGIKYCPEGKDCVSHSPCETNFHWPGQDTNDDPRCNLTQSDGRQQGSHSVGLIYVYPHGPQLSKDHPDFDAKQVHQRSPTLSALEVRDTFKTRMGWTDQETVALVGGGHTLGRTHGNCASNPNKDEPCKGKYTMTAGYEGAWTRTPSKWNYDFFEAMLADNWTATKSPDGFDQWGTADASSKYSSTMRLTSDLALVNDDIYMEWVKKYNDDHKLFDKDFADAWFKLVHRSGNHPGDDDLEKDANKCTTFDFAEIASETVV